MSRSGVRQDKYMTSNITNSGNANNAHVRVREGLSFRVDCIPPTATAQHKGVFVVNGRPRFFTKRPVRQAEGFLAALISMHAPDAPFGCPVSLTVRWTFPFRKSERKSVVRAGADVPHTSRPDLDNLEKSLLDVLTRLNFWTDDSLVAEKRTSKRWGARPGIEIGIEPLTGG